MGAVLGPSFAGPGKGPQLIPSPYVDMMWSGTRRGAPSENPGSRPPGARASRRAQPGPAEQAEARKRQGCARRAPEVNATASDLKWPHAEAMPPGAHGRCGGAATGWKTLGSSGHGEQARLKARVVLGDTEAWQRDPDFSGLRRVGAWTCLSRKGGGGLACASLVVLRLPPELEVVHEDQSVVSLTAPYVPGFLAFREAPLPGPGSAAACRQRRPTSCPRQVLLVDGNGVLHHRGFWGVACHLGVLTDLPCIGVAKKLLQVDGLENNAEHKEKIRLLQTPVDRFPLTGASGGYPGMALRDPRAQHQAPCNVSVGHRISLEAAVRLTLHCCRFKSPEPVPIPHPQADIRSREHLRRTLGNPTTPEPTRARSPPAPSPTSSPQRGTEEPGG
ncbi:LOW QUALITY PROTEIN: endonuclease V [Suncus etruscus]|uniref:LOW QUALITY PROTEIN: endonuclease V n=1 Tax=Suncus etruscus TaxID=109475 RepID=UPI00210F932E|nr:LOW QUALITY PROTEIN: endonuclease V [Suncus etruscus]